MRFSHTFFFLLVALCSVLAWTTSVLGHDAFTTHLALIEADATTTTTLTTPTTDAAELVDAEADAAELADAQSFLATREQLKQSATPAQWHELLNTAQSNAALFEAADRQWLRALQRQDWARNPQLARQYQQRVDAVTDEVIAEFLQQSEGASEDSPRLMQLSSGAEAEAEAEAEAAAALLTYAPGKLSFMNMLNAVKATSKAAVAKAKTAVRNVAKKANTAAKKAKTAVANVAKRATTAAKNTAKRVQTAAKKTVQRAKNTAKRATASATALANKAKAKAAAAAATARATAARAQAVASQKLAEAKAAAAKRARAAADAVKAKYAKGKRVVQQKVAQVKAATQQKVTAAQQRVNKAVQSVKQTTKKVLTATKTATNKAIKSVKTATNKAVKSVKTATNKAVKSVKSATTKAVNGAKAATTKAINGAKAATTKAINGAKAATTKAVNGAKAATTKAINGAKAATTKAINGAKAATAKAVNGAKAATTKAVNGAKAVAGKAKSAVADAVAASDAASRHYQRRFGDVGRAFLNKLSNSTKTVKGAVSSLAKDVKGKVVQAGETAKDMATRFSSILKQKATNVTTALKNSKPAKMVGAVTDQVQGLVKQIHTPLEQVNNPDHFDPKTAQRLLTMSRMAYCSRKYVTSKYGKPGTATAKPRFKQVTATTDALSDMIASQSLLSLSHRISASSRLRQLHTQHDATAVTLTGSDSAAVVAPTPESELPSNFQLVSDIHSSARDNYAYAGIETDPTTKQKTIVLAFKGTDPKSYKNIMSDLNAFKLETEHGFVDKGFGHAYSTIQKQVRDSIVAAKRQCPSCRVEITGHSLGGALATLAAADLTNSGIIDGKSTNVYTYGSPRVGDNSFANWYNKNLPNTYRITSDKDVVPHVGPRFLGYAHVGREIFYPGDAGAKGTAPVRCRTGEDPDCSAKVGIHLIEGIGDHTNYLGQSTSCVGR